MSPRTVATVVLPLLVACTSAANAGEAGESSAEFLSIGMGARAAALGGATRTLVADPSALQWNPAGLAFNDGVVLLASHRSGIVDTGDSYLGAAAPFVGGTVAGAAGQFSAGDLEGRDDQGEPTSDFDAGNLVVTMGYGLQAGEHLALGASGGWVRDRIDESVENAVFLSAGGLYRPTHHLRIAAVVANLGSKLGEDPLPTELAAAVGAVGDSWAAEIGVVAPLRSTPSLAMGAEYSVVEPFALRAGYDTSRDVGSGGSFGFGIEVRQLRIDYAYVPVAELGDEHHMALRVSL